MSKKITESTNSKISNNPKVLWDFYSNKFDLYKNVNEHKIIVFALTVINDFLSGNLQRPEILVGRLYTDQKLKKFTHGAFAKRQSKLHSLLLEILDIGWMKDATPNKEYEEYLKELREKYHELAAHYEDII